MDGVMYFVDTQTGLADLWTMVEIALNNNPGILQLETSLSSYSSWYSFFIKAVCTLIK